MATLSSSDSSVKGRACSARNRRWLSGDCGLTADDAQARGEDARMQVAQVAGLACAPRREVSRVEIEDQGIALDQVRQPARPAVLVRQREVRCLDARFQHGDASSWDSGPR